MTHSSLTKTFFEKFELFADAPGAVAKMRELVRNFAVTGKLVPQDPKDEPAEELLDSIKAAREALVIERRVRQSDEVEYSLQDEADDAPPGWVGVHVSDVAIVQGGKRLPNGAVFSEATTPHVYIRVTDMKNGTISETGLRYISPKVHREIARYIINKEDLYITIAGTIGDVGCVPESLDGHNLTENAAKIVFRGFDKRFFQLTLTSEFVQSQFLEKTKQMAQPKLALKRIAGAKFYLPPLAEQKRIVAKVDELMALCDRLEAQQQERETRHATLARASLARFAEAPTPANLEFLFHKSYAIEPADLRKSILTLAVQGLLVPHDDESADWETKKLKDLTTKIGSGSTPSGGKESYHEAGVPLIRSMNVHFGGFVRNGLVYLNDEQAEKLKNVTVKADDVLLNITGASIGRVATAPKDMQGARVNQHVCILRPTDEITPPFLELFLASPVVQNLIEDIQVGATREALTKTMIEQFEIPVPSLAEQHRVVAKVEELMALVDELESQLTASRATASRLLDAIVAELTAQD
jgi:type I restriction enzyme S subunit